MARTGTQAAHAHLHGIECVERLTLYSLLGRYFGALLKVLVARSHFIELTFW